MSMRAFGQTSPFAPRPFAAQSQGVGDDWNGNYRTLCVRMCDGYYFPISYRTTRGRIYHDAKVCEASCDCETKLFYLPSGSSDVKHATDVTGRTYGRLENAFEYRREWDQSCTCRPAPWTEPEKIRHESYAAAAAEVRSENQLRRGEMLLALIEREDAKDAAVEEARLAKLRAKQPKDAHVKPQLAQAQPQPASEPAAAADMSVAIGTVPPADVGQPAGPADSPIVVATAEAESTQAQGASPVASTPTEAAAPVVSKDARQTGATGRRLAPPATRTRQAGAKPGKSRQGASKSGKPASRGFLQL